ncbi:MAG: hypothetical protein K2Y21_07325 [Phycisphaerales bacterium]|nr:hypothetical protein [Phycisphaerales bacterium]
MPKPSPWPARNPAPAFRAACLAALLLASTAHAQRLNLGSTEPAPGSGNVALRDAQTLRESAAALKQNKPASEQFLAAYTALAAALLEQGEALGVPGSRHIAAARKLQAAQPALSAALATKLTTDAELAALTQSIDALAATTITVDTLDAELRSTFAPLVEKLDPSHALAAWPTIVGAPSPAWPEFKSTDSTALADTIKALEPLQQRVSLASKWTAYKPGADALTRLIRDAGGCFGRESKLPANTYKRWLKELALGAQEILADTSTDAPQADRGLARLRRLAAWSRVLDALERHTNAPAFKPITDAIGPAFELMPDEPPAPTAANADRLTRLVLWLESMPARDALQDDSTVIRQLRPAFRSIAELCRGSQSEAIDAVTAAIRKADAAGDPGVLAAVNMHQRHTRLLALIRRTSDALREPQAAAEPTLRENAKPLADALLKLAKDVADPKQRDQAIDGLSNLASDCADLLDLPGERRLRERDAALDDVLGTQSGTLLDAVERERAQWRRKASNRSGPGGEQHAARLRALAATLALAADIADLESDRAALTRFGGWTLDDADLVKLLNDAKGALRAFVATASDPDEAKARDAARAADQLAARHAVVRVAAHVCRVTRDRKELVADSDAARAAVLLMGVCAGAPDPRWTTLGPERDSLAALCRYATESRESQRVAEYANNRANELLERVLTR